MKMVNGKTRYTQNIALSTGSIGSQAGGTTSTFTPPVGITSLTSANVLVSLRATGFDAHRFGFALQQRNMPTSLVIEVFNTWTGGALTIAGTFTVQIEV